MTSTLIACCNHHFDEQFSNLNNNNQQANFEIQPHTCYNGLNGNKHVKSWGNIVFKSYSWIVMCKKNIAHNFQVFKSRVYHDYQHIVTFANNMVGRKARKGVRMLTIWFNIFNLKVNSKN